MKRKIKIFLLFIILLTFTLSCSYASNETNDNIDDDTASINEVESNKIVQKTQINKENKKEATEVTSYDMLISELRTNDENKVVNIKKGTYKVKEPVALKICSYKKNLVINGNGAIIDGDNSKSFLTISTNNDVTINNLVIRNTKATNEASAINTSSSVHLKLNNCSFINCLSNGKGGALANRGITEINNCVFSSNTGNHGGAIWSTGEYGGSLLIKNSKFINNNAHFAGNHDKTAVVYVVSGGKVNITSNTFENNIGKSIHNYRADLYVTGNTFKNSALTATADTIRGGVIDNYEHGAVINNNVFSNINLTAKDVRGGILYTEMGTSSFEKNTISNLRIITKGQIDSLNGGILFNRNSTLTVSNNKISNYNNGYKIHGGSLYNNIGTLKVYSNTFTTSNVASNEIRGGAIYNDKVGNTNSKLYYGGNTFKITNSGKVTNGIIYNLGVSQETAVPVTKKSTKITVNSISATQQNSIVTVTGKYTDVDGNALRYTPITIKINGVSYTNSTNGNGLYTYKYKATKLGTNNITVSYAGNSKYLGASAKTSFNVVNRKYTKITINSISTSPLNGMVTVKGKYTDADGNALRYTPIVIKINGVTYTNKTNGNGVYTYKYNATKLGTNNITVSYAGNSKYWGATAKRSFSVVNKTASKITVNSITNQKVNTYVTIKGKYTDSNGNNLRYTPITIKINGIKYTNKTNGNGVYTYRFKVTAVGTNNITVSYPGNSRYIGATAKRTFKVTK